MFSHEHVYSMSNWSSDFMLHFHQLHLVLMLCLFQLFVTATNRRSRQTQQDLKTTRRRGSTLTATRTFRRGSQYQEIQVAALPDLSENLINESQTWEEIREIKAMPVPMAQKRELKNQLQVSFSEVFLSEREESEKKFNFSI